MSDTEPVEPDPEPGNEDDPDHASEPALEPSE